jgi:hypothetical protein
VADNDLGNALCCRFEFWRAAINNRSALGGVSAKCKDVGVCVLRTCVDGVCVGRPGGSISLPVRGAYVNEYVGRRGVDVGGRTCVVGISIDRPGGRSLPVCGAYVKEYVGRLGVDVGGTSSLPVNDDGCFLL